MGEYRAYILGVDGHRFVWADQFVCDQPNDNTAIEAARSLSDKHDIEVWTGSRLVARLQGHTLSAAQLNSAKATVAGSVPLSRISDIASTLVPTNNPFLSNVSEVIDLPPVLPPKK